MFKEDNQPPKYQIVGECYLDAAMEGELADLQNAREIVVV
jgi:hypothetical protein